MNSGWDPLRRKKEIKNGLLGTDSDEGKSFVSLVSPILRKEGSGQDKSCY